MSVDEGELWRRIREHEGEEFVLIRGGRFTYEVLGNYLRPVGRVRHLSRSNFAKALERVPLSSYTDVRDLQGPSYVFAVMTDVRIRRKDW